MIDRRPRRVPSGSGACVIEAEATSLVADSARLAAYREVCEVPDDDHLPLTFPHLLASGVHMGMLLHPAFPVRMVGIVHLTNDIELFRPLPADARLALDCRLESGRSKPRGDEFRMVTEALWNGELAWRETMSFLAPAPITRELRTSAEIPAWPPLVGQWEVPADIGRRYARVSGDWNPIHLGNVLARPFGFPGAIAHGMWTVGRCLGRLTEGPVGAGARLDVRFMKPLVLPGTARLHREAPDETGDQVFWLVSADGSAAYLRGRWNPGRPDE